MIGRSSIVMALALAGCVDGPAPAPSQVAVAEGLVLRRLSSGATTPTSIALGSTALISRGSGTRPDLVVAPALRLVRDGIQILSAEGDGVALCSLSLDVDPIWRIEACYAVPVAGDGAAKSLVVLGRVDERLLLGSNSDLTAVTRQALFVVDVERSAVIQQREWMASEFQAGVLSFHQQDGAVVLVVGSSPARTGRGSVRLFDLPSLRPIGVHPLPEAARPWVFVWYASTRQGVEDRVVVPTENGLAALDAHDFSIVGEFPAGRWSLTACPTVGRFDWDGDGAEDLVVLRQSSSSFEPVSMPSGGLFVVSGRSLETIVDIVPGARSGIGLVLDGRPLVLFSTAAGIGTVAPMQPERWVPESGVAGTLPSVDSLSLSESGTGAFLGVLRWHERPPLSEQSSYTIELWQASPSER